MRPSSGAGWSAQLDGDDPDRAGGSGIRLEAVRSAQQAQAAAYFATVAERWDELRRLHVPEEAVEAAILEAVEGRVVDLLIDLGTGTGRMLELLKDHYRRAIGIDASREMIAVARAKLAAANIGTAQVRLGDIADLDGSAGPADLVVIHQVLHYFDDPARAARPGAPRARPGGELLIVDFAPHDLEFLRAEHAHRRLGLSEGQMAGWARSAGLRIAELTTFPPSHDAEGLTVCLWRLGNQNRTPDEPSISDQPRQPPDRQARRCSSRSSSFRPRPTRWRSASGNRYIGSRRSIRASSRSPMAQAGRPASERSAW